MEGVARAEQVIAVECARFGVPGAAVVAVSGGDVVLAEGFGRATDREAVTPSTLFMLASDTKCLAATTLCLLVEDGLLDLDAPLRDYLPWFAMHDDTTSDLITSRDLLAHRTGLPRHALMTLGNGRFTTSNEDIARRMRFLEASKPFRQGFGYNNVHYATAGHVAEVVSGQPWRELLADRVLQPLGMTSTTTYSPALTRSGFAAPHVAGTAVPFQTRHYDLPSGGVVTNAEDLGRWLLARLGRGPLSHTILAMLHEPVVAAPDAPPFPELRSTGYGLGTTGLSYRGHQLHLHGGSQIGYSSQVLVVPDADLGIAVLTNSHGSGLPLALSLALVDALLGLEPLPWGERLFVKAPAPPAPAPSETPVRDLGRFVGAFHHPAYGDLALDVHDGRLRPSFHGLDDELALTHVDLDSWLLTMTSLPEMRVPMTFRTGPDGGALDVAVALEPELAPLIFQRR